MVYGLIASSTSIASGGVLGFSAVAEKPMKLVDGFSDDHISWFGKFLLESKYYFYDLEKNLSKLFRKKIENCQLNLLILT